MAGKFGSTNRKSRALAKEYKIQPFESREAVIRFSQDMAELALKAPVDLRRVDTALRAAGMALTAFAQEMNERLVNALLKVEHGGLAYTLFRGLMSPTPQTLRRPLPPRVLSQATPEDASA